MIQNIIKYFLGMVFLFSAITKLIDYHSTVELFENLLAINIISAKILLSVLILVELIITYLIVGDYIEKKFVFQTIIGMLLIFLFVSILFGVYGYSNCGCFGAEIISSPLISIAKNILLLSLLFYLKHSSASSRLCGEMEISK